MPTARPRRSRLCPFYCRWTYRARYFTFSCAAVFTPFSSVPCLQRIAASGLQPCATASILPGPPCATGGTFTPFATRLRSRWRLDCWRDAFPGVCAETPCRVWRRNCCLPTQRLCRTGKGAAHYRSLRYSVYIGVTAATPLQRAGRALLAPTFQAVPRCRTYRYILPFHIDVTFLLYGCGCLLVTCCMIFAFRCAHGVRT